MPLNHKKDTRRVTCTVKYHSKKAPRISFVNGPDNNPRSVIGDVYKPEQLVR